MPDLSPPPPLAPARDALFLDLDGTLVALAPHPDAIVVAPDLPARLARLEAALGGCLVLVSGRRLADLDRFLGEGVTRAAGIHGLELRGLSAAIDDDAGEAEALAAARARLAGAPHGLLVEDKGRAIALHFRTAPHLASAAERLAGEIAAASLGRLAVQPGHMVFELKPAGASKGAAVRAFMAEPTFAGRRPVFAGDDLTDESAFAACAALDGYGVLVGERRQTAARYHLADVAAVHGWLAAAAGEADVRPPAPGIFEDRSSR